MKHQMSCGVVLSHSDVRSCMANYRYDIRVQREKRKYYANLDIKVVQDNKKFWKNIKSFFRAPQASVKLLCSIKKKDKPAFCQNLAVQAVRVRIFGGSCGSGPIFLTIRSVSCRFSTYPLTRVSTVSCHNTATLSTQHVTQVQNLCPAEYQDITAVSKSGHLMHSPDH